MTTPGKQPNHLDAGPLRLKLSPGLNGPELDQDNDFESLCWVVGSAGETEEVDELGRAIEAGEPFCMENFRYERLGPEDEYDTGKELWTRRTGQELTGELWIAWIGAKNRNIFPLSAAQQAYRTLRAMREPYKSSAL
jgi:hypothetical protein